MKSNVCIICRYNSINDKVMTMKILIDILSRAKIIPNTNSINFDWGSVERCKYGIPTCNKIQEQQTYYKNCTSKLNGMLTELCKSSSNDKLYYEILSLLRGKFPKVYVQFEREYRKYH